MHKGRRGDRLPAKTTVNYMIIINLILISMLKMIYIDIVIDF